MTFQKINDNPVIDTSVLKEKWGRESIDNFNKFMISVRDLLTRNEEIKSSVKNGFRDLKLLNVKLSKSQKGDMACVFINMETRAVFDFYYISGNIEIVDYESAFQYKETVQKRLDAAQKMEKDEKEDYLNRYCHVDFDLLNSVCIELENRPKEEFFLPKGFRINSGESKTFINKKIDLTNDIECEGELSFVNCEIWYHNKYEGQIIINNLAKLNIDKCIFRCFGCNEEMPLIKLLESPSTLSAITFKDSKFYDCSNLIFGNYGCIISRLDIERCEFFDCFNLILDAKVIGGCKIKNCKFITRRIADFYLNNDEYKIKNIIGLDEGDLYLENLEVRFDKEIIKTIKEKNKKCKESKNLLEAIFSFVSHGDGIESCFLLKNGKYNFIVEKCYFENVGWCLSGVLKANQCEFDNCRIVMHYVVPSNMVKGKIVENCKFKNCEEAIDYCENARIVNCTFDNCKKKILELSGDNSSVVDCIFKNIALKEEDGDSPSDKFFENSLITCSDGIHCIKECKFENIVKNETRPRKFLIGFSGCDKFGGRKVLQLQGCQFKECQGHLINCYHHWFEEGGLFSSDRSGEELATEFFNCTGIDNNGNA